MRNGVGADHGARGGGAESDMLNSLPYMRKIFDVFHASGGVGEFLAFGKVLGVPRTATGNGHALFEHLGMWKAAVAAYLPRIDGG